MNESPAEIVVHHLTECTDAKAVIVVDGSADETIAGLLAKGWTLSERVDLVAGKRIRFLRVPGPVEAEIAAGERP